MYYKAQCITVRLCQNGGAELVSGRGGHAPFDSPYSLTAVAAAVLEGVTCWRLRAKTYVSGGRFVSVRFMPRGKTSVMACLMLRNDMGCHLWGMHGAALKHTL
jgi:hypothetical protein